MTKHERATALEALIDKYGLLAVMESLADICDSKAEHVAVNWQDCGLAKAWALAQNKIREAQQGLRPLDL